jgi:hypothetical protein
MSNTRHHFHLCSMSLAAGLAVASLFGQTPPPASKPAPDTVVLVDGEKLIGHFVRSAGGDVTFHSDVLGDVTVAWSKIQEMHAAAVYVVFQKEVTPGGKGETPKIVKGTIEVSGQTIQIHPSGGGTAESMPVTMAARVMDEGAYAKETHHASFGEGWTGAITAGASIVESTQQGRTFTGAISLVRAVPLVSTLPARDRTSFNFSGTDGFLSQPGTPSVKTEILHFDAERDEYFHGSNVYGFGQAAYDHNYSQGLDLQQDYGVGIGWTAIKRDNETLDLKGSANFVRQQFQDASRDQNLAASAVAEAFLRKFGHGVVFQEQLAITPTWSNLGASLANASASINAPVFKRMSFTVRAGDSFLGRPSPGFKKNSFELTMGFTYTLK